MKYLFWKIRFFFAIRREVPGCRFRHAFYLANSWDADAMDDLSPEEAAYEERTAEAWG